MLEDERREFGNDKAVRYANCMTDVTKILVQLENGDRSSAEQLLPLVYDELKKLAAARLAHEKPGQTLQATALVHEAYVRLVDNKSAQNWNSRGHFFGAAAEAMRRILIDAAREKQALRRGGAFHRQGLSEIDIPADGDEVDVLALDEAIGRLTADQPRAAEVVKLRYFCGMSIADVADVLQVSRATVERDWSYARARLHAELSG